MWPLHPVPVLDRLLLYCGFVLVLFCLFCLPAGLWFIGNEVQRISSRLFWLLLSLSIVAIAIRLLAPHRLTMYFMGYAMIDLADRLYTVPKYGPAGQVLHHLLFMLTGPSHDAVTYLNSVIGGLIVFSGSASLLALGLSTIESLVMAVLLAFTPLFIRDQTSESLLVPMLLWLFLGIAVLWFRGAVWHKVMGVSFLLLACFSRAETPFLVPFCLLVLFFAQKPDLSWLRFKGILCFLALVAILYCVRLIHLYFAVAHEVSLGNNPNLTTPLFSQIPGLIFSFFYMNAAFRPSLFPVLITILALLSVFGRRRRIALAFLILFCIFAFVSGIDLPYVSIPRIQAPALAFLCACASMGFYEVYSRFRNITYKRVFSCASIALYGVSGAWTIPTLYQRLNPDEEEELLHEALEVLPKDKYYVLATRTFFDEPMERVHLHIPSYLFEGEVIGLDEMQKRLEEGKLKSDAFVLIGVRCYMRACTEQGIHPACERAMKMQGLVPLIEKVVPVHRPKIIEPLDSKRSPEQDLDFPWCVPVNEMKLGLYKVSKAD